MTTALTSSTADERAEERRPVGDDEREVDAHPDGDQENAERRGPRNGAVIASTSP